MKTISFSLKNKPFERRGVMARGTTTFRDDRKSPKGGRAGEKVRFKKGEF
jgi:hypothetical protein